MALPTTILSQASIEGPGPRVFKSSAGNFYAVVLSTTPTIEIHKATDPTDSWTVQDAGNESVSNVHVLVCRQDGDLIRMAFWSTDPVNNIRWLTFDMSDDTYDAELQITAILAADIPDFPWVDMVRRPNGEWVAVWAGATDNVMGDRKQRVDYKISTTVVTWPIPVFALDAAGDIHYGNPVCDASSAVDNDVHIRWNQTADLADPAASWEETQGRTLRADDTLSTTSSADDGAQDLFPCPGIISYDDAGTDRLLTITQNDGFVGALRARRFTLDGSDDFLITGGGAEVASTSHTPKATNNQQICTLVGPDANGDFHVLWSNTDNGDDIYYSTATDGLGAVWSTEAEELDAVTCNFIHANIYVRGSDTVLAYVYDDGGVQKYNEKVLIEGALDISPATIAATGVVFSPTITTGAVDISPATIAATGVVFSPTVALMTNIDVPLIAATGQVFDPTVTVGAADISPDVIAATGTVFQPTLTTGVVDISPATIAATGQVFNPTVTSTVDVSVPLIVATGVVFNPTIAVGAVDISPATIAATGVVFEPTVTLDAGVQDISPDTIAATGVVFSPTLTTGAVDISPAVIAATGTVFSPTLTTTVDVSPATIAATGAVFSPTITTGVVGLSPDLIASTGVVFTPTVALDVANRIQVEFADESVITANGGSRTFYFNGKDYFEI